MEFLTTKTAPAHRGHFGKGDRSGHGSVRYWPRREEISCEEGVKATGRRRRSAAETPELRGTKTKSALGFGMAR